MNQVTNLVQWKNLTDDEKAEFDFEGYAYQFQWGEDWSGAKITPINSIDGEHVFRLKIEPEKWYYWEAIGLSGVTMGKDLNNPSLEGILRPAKPSEIPEPETLEDKSKAELIDNWEKLERWVDDIQNYEPNQIGEYSYFRVDRFKDLMKDIKAGVG